MRQLQVSAADAKKYTLYILKTFFKEDIMSKEQQTAGQTATEQVGLAAAEAVANSNSLVDLFADDCEATSSSDVAAIGADLSEAQIAQIASIRLYDHDWIPVNDRARMKVAHQRVLQGIPGKHRSNFSRTIDPRTGRERLAASAYVKACRIASKICGTEFKPTADTLTDAQKVASRMSGFVKNYARFVETAKDLPKGTNGYKLAVAMGLIKEEQPTAVQQG